jgi:hypothetical protein
MACLHSRTSAASPRSSGQGFDLWPRTGHKRRPATPERSDRLRRCPRGFSSTTRGNPRSSKLTGSAGPSRDLVQRFTGRIRCTDAPGRGQVLDRFAGGCGRCARVGRRWARAPLRRCEPDRPSSRYSIPAIVARPWSGLARSGRIFIAVDFPAPLGQEAGDPPGLDREREVVDDDLVPVALGDILELKRVRGRRSSRWPVV